MLGRIVLGVSGGIAAYKAIEVLRELQRYGNEVRVIMTRNAAEFVSPRTFAVLSDHPVEVDQWTDASRPGVDHVALSHWSDLLLVAPATANLIASMSTGIARDALTTYALAHRRRVAVAPAMNTEMWSNQATRANLEILRKRGVEIVEPASGMLACGDAGTGRLADVETVVDRSLRLLPRRGPMAGLRILINAGGTREAVDAVRVLGNRSSGRQGVALAREALELGAEVILINAPMSVPAPLGVEQVEVESAAQMRAALAEHAPRCDAAFLAAAIADFRPAVAAEGKLDRRAGSVAIEVEPVEDLAAELGTRSDRPYLVVFSAEHGDKRDRALEKMYSKGADAVVFNDISASDRGMESADNAVWIASRSGRRIEVELSSKDLVARRILRGLCGEVLAYRSRRGRG